MIDATAPVSSSLLTSAFLREFYYPFTDRIFLQAAFAFPLLLWPLLCGSASPFPNHPSCPSHSVLNISSYVCLEAMIISLLLYITADLALVHPPAQPAISAVLSFHLSLLVSSKTLLFFPSDSLSSPLEFSVLE